MAKKNTYSIKDELIRKSREAMVMAVQTYNNSSLAFKAETFITLVVISWPCLLHASYRKKRLITGIILSKESRNDMTEQNMGRISTGNLIAV